MMMYNYPIFPWNIEEHLILEFHRQSPQTSGLNKSSNWQENIRVFFWSLFRISLNFMYLQPAVMN